MKKKVKTRNCRKLNKKVTSTSYLPLHREDNEPDFKSTDTVTVKTPDGKYEWSGPLKGVTATFAYAELTCTKGDARDEILADRGIRSDESVTITVDGGGGGGGNDTKDAKTDLYSE